MEEIFLHQLQLLRGDLKSESKSMKGLRKFINSLMSEVEPLNSEKLVSESASTGAAPHSLIMVFRVCKMHCSAGQSPAIKNCLTISNKLGYPILEMEA